MFRYFVVSYSTIPVFNGAKRAIFTLCTSLASEVSAFVKPEQAADAGSGSLQPASNNDCDALALTLMMKCKDCDVFWDSFVVLCKKSEI